MSFYIVCCAVIMLGNHCYQETHHSNTLMVKIFSIFISSTLIKHWRYFPLSVVCPPNSTSRKGSFHLCMLYMRKFQSTRRHLSLIALPFELSMPLHYLCRNIYAVSLLGRSCTQMESTNTEVSSKTSLPPLRDRQGSFSPVGATFLPKRSDLGWPEGEDVKPSDISSHVRLLVSHKSLCLMPGCHQT